MGCPTWPCLPRRRCSRVHTPCTVMRPALRTSSSSRRDLRFSTPLRRDSALRRRERRSAWCRCRAGSSSKSSLRSTKRRSFPRVSRRGCRSRLDPPLDGASTLVTRASRSAWMTLAHPLLVRPCMRSSASLRTPSKLQRRRCWHKWYLTRALPSDLLPPLFLFLSQRCLCVLFSRPHLRTQCHDDV